MKLARLLVPALRLLLAIAIVGGTFTSTWLVRPMSREAAIRIAREHASKRYPGIDLDGYAISARRYDWFTEWGIYFRHKTRDAGFIIDVDGGDVYEGLKLRVFLDDEWGHNGPEIAGRVEQPPPKRRSVPKLGGWMTAGAVDHGTGKGCWCLGSSGR